MNSDAHESPPRARSKNRRNLSWFFSVETSRCCLARDDCASQQREGDARGRPGETSSSLSFDARAFDSSAEVYALLGLGLIYARVLVFGGATMLLKLLKGESEEGRAMKMK